jgi:IMP dehydrogenase
MILDPITILLIPILCSRIDGKYRISGVPVTENGKLIGIITNRIFGLRQFNRKFQVTKERLITLLSVRTSIRRRRFS